MNAHPAVACLMRGPRTRGVRRERPCENGRAGQAYGKNGNKAAKESSWTMRAA